MIRIGEIWFSFEVHTFNCNCRIVCIGECNGHDKYCPDCLSSSLDKILAQLKVA